MSVDSQRLDLGLVDSIRAQTFGDPGQRTFRLLVKTTEGEVSLWMEKEQLMLLGSAIEEVLQRMPEPQGEEPAGEAESAFRGELEVRVGSLAVGYDTQGRSFLVEASDFTSPFDLSSIRLLARRADFARVAGEISEIVAAGRPRCPLCGTPLLGVVHFCPPSNGHARLTVAD